MVASLATLGELARRIPRLEALCAEQIVSAPDGDGDAGDAADDAALVDQWGRLHGLVEVTVIGREPGPGGVAVLEASVSRRHAELRVLAERWELRDLGSTNGTFLDGRRLDAGAGAALADGALIVVGDVGFVFVAERGERLAAAATESIRATAAHRPAAPGPAMRLVAQPNGAGGLCHGPDGAVQLASTQFALMALLAARQAEEATAPDEVRGFVRSVELQASLPWDTPHPEDNHVKQLVRRLRRALERGGLPGAIESRHGFGYRLLYAARVE